MAINFNLIKLTFDNETIADHKIIVKKGKNYELVSKSHASAHSNKVPLSTVLSTLFREVKSEGRTTKELEKALQITHYFAHRTSHINRHLFFKISEIFKRFKNLIIGNGFNTNSELALKINNYLAAKLEKPVCLKGFKSDNFWTCLSKNQERALDPVFKTDPDFQIISENFKKFCDKAAANKEVTYVKPPENPTIPPLIHFIWLGSALPPKINEIIDTWRTCHPGWTVKIWGDRDVDNFPWQNRQAFDEALQAKCWAEAADIWRYEILYKEGGIYSDTDVVCFKSFNDLIANDVKFFAGQETNQVNPWMKEVHDYEHPLYVCNAIMGVAKNSPIMKFCMDHLKPISKSKFPTAPRGDILSRTGPVLLSRACREGLQSAEKDQVLVLPCSYLYPLPFFLDGRHKKMSQEKIRRDYIQPESLVVHLWDASW